MSPKVGKGLRCLLPRDVVEIEVELDVETIFDGEVAVLERQQSCCGIVLAQPRCSKVLYGQSAVATSAGTSTYPIWSSKTWCVRLGYPGHQNRAPAIIGRLNASHIVLCRSVFRGVGLMRAVLHCGASVLQISSASDSKVLDDDPAREGERPCVPPFIQYVSPRCTVPTLTRETPRRCPWHERRCVEDQGET